MTNAEFWNFIERSRGSGFDHDYSQRLTSILQNLTAKEVADFYNQIGGLFDSFNAQ